jgi:hypothetical protein
LNMLVWCDVPQSRWVNNSKHFEGAYFLSLPARCWKIFVRRQSVIFRPLFIFKYLVNSALPARRKACCSSYKLSKFYSILTQNAVCRKSSIFTFIKTRSGFIELLHDGVSCASFRADQIRISHSTF